MWTWESGLLAPCNGGASESSSKGDRASRSKSSHTQPIPYDHPNLAERTTRQTFVDAFIPVQTGDVLRCPPLLPVSITHPPPDVSYRTSTHRLHAFSRAWHRQTSTLVWLKHTLVALGFKTSGPLQQGVVFSRRRFRRSSGEVRKFSSGELAHLEITYCRGRIEYDVPPYL